MSDDNTTIDFDALALPQDFDNLLGAKKILTHVPLRKPLRHEWVRAHRTWQQSAPVLRLQGDRKDELYLLVNELVPAVPRDLVTGMTFVATVSRQGTTFLWPLRVPNSNGRPDVWAHTALDICQIARDLWVQLHSDQRLGAYTCLKLPDLTDDPVWPDLSWPELRQLAFRDHFIDRLDHPILDMVLRGK